MRPSVKMDFGDFNPDTADYWNDGATTAQNVLPTLAAPNYSSMQSLVLTAIGGVNTSTYNANAVTFAGGTNLLSTAITGLVNGKSFSSSIWFRFDAAGSPHIINLNEDSNEFVIRISAGSQIQVIGHNSAGTIIFNAHTSAILSPGATWHNLLVSVNLATAAANMWLDGASNITVVTNTNDTLAWVGPLNYIGDAADSGNSSAWSEAEIWWDNSFIDFSVSDNRLLFRNASGFPVSLGSTGQTPTGSSPKIYLKSAAASVATNSGTGGNFTLSGSASIASASPSQGNSTTYSQVSGGISTIDGNDLTHTYIGNATQLAEITATQANNLSQVGGYTAQAIWKFTQFTGLAAGNLVIATDYNDPIQSMAVGGTVFANLAGSPPKASAIATVNQFLMVGDTTGGTYNSTTQGAIPNRVWWSAIGNPANWPDPATLSATAAQSNFKDLPPNLGRVQDIKGRYEYGIVLQENGLSRFQYQGGDVPFYITTYDTERGLYCRNAAIQIGNDVHFLHSSGFYKTDGAQVAPTGHGLVDDTFLADLNTAYRDHVRVSHMEGDKCILWAYPSITMTPLGLFPVCDKVIAYNYVDGRWAMGMVGQSIDMLFDAKSLAYTMEQLDSVNSNLDLISPSLDDPFWNGGIPIVGAFGIQLVTGSTYASYYGSLTGSDLTATLETKSYNLNQGGRALMTAVKPIVLNGSPVVTCQVGTRALLTAAATYTASLPIEARTGKASCRADGVFHTVRVQITGNFENALGVEPEFKPSGWA